MGGGEFLCLFLFQFISVKCLYKFGGVAFDITSGDVLLLYHTY